MTQAQHLPGPWEVEARGDDSLISTRYGRTVAIAPWDSDTLESHQATVAAIAAAPAMLAALEAGEGYLTNHADKGDAAAQGLAAMFRAAIAQARGAPTGEGGQVAPADDGVWRIVASHTDPDTEGALYWSNTDGWTTLARSSAFSHTERQIFNLPMGAWWFDADEGAHPIPGEEAECGTCDWRGPESALQPIVDVFQRVAPGEPMPAGECPECGALAHLTGEG